MKHTFQATCDPEELYRLNQEIKKLTQAMVDPGNQDPQLLATKLNATLVIVGFILENFIHQATNDNRTSNPTYDPLALLTHPNNLDNSRLQLVQKTSRETEKR
jgi:hypothetical protein